MLMCAGALVVCAQPLQKSDLELEAFAQSPATFSSGSAPAARPHWESLSRRAERTDQPRLSQFSNPQLQSASAGQRLPAPIATSRLRYHPLLTTPALSQDGTFAKHAHDVSPRPREFPLRTTATMRHITPDYRENNFLTMCSAYRSVTLPPRSSPASPPARAAPTFVFPSRTPARPRRRSTDGRSPVPSSTSRTSRVTLRPSP